MKIYKLFIYLNLFFAFNSNAIAKSYIIDENLLFDRSIKKYKNLNYIKKKGLYYYLRADAQRYINIILNIPEIDLVVFTPSFKKKQIESSIIEKVGASFYSREDLKDYFVSYFNKSEVNPGFLKHNNYKYFTNNSSLINSDELSLINIEKDYFYFDSLKDKQETYEKLSKAKKKKYEMFFSSDEDLSTLYSNKWALILSHIVIDTWNIDKRPSVEHGRSVFNLFDQNSGFVFEVQNDLIIGCRSNKTHDSVDLNFCLKNKTISYRWTYTGDFVNKCYSSYSNYLYEEQSADTCIKKLGSTYQWYKDLDKNKCRFVTLNDKKIITDEIDNRKCESISLYQYRWTVDKIKKKILGCEYVDQSQNFILKKINISSCLRDKLLPTKILWVLDNNQKIKGCALFDESESNFIKEEDEAICIKQSNIVFEWEYNKEKTKVAKCKKVDKNTNKYFTDPKLEECIKHLKTEYYWKFTDNKVSGCHLVARDSGAIHIRDESIDKCIKHSGAYLKVEKLKDDKVLCNLYSKFGDKFIRNEDVLHCIEKGVSNLKYNWIGNDKEKVSCKAEFEGQVVKSDIDVKTCLNVLESKKAWSSTNKNSCKLYTGSGIEIKTNKKVLNCSNIYRLSSNKYGVFFHKSDENMSGKTVDTIYQLSYSFNHSLNLSSLNAKPGKYIDIDLPMTYTVKYRGMGRHQYSLTKAIRAMFGELKNVVESKAVTKLKFLLQEKEPPVDDKSIFYTAEKIASDYLLENDPLSEEEALRQSIKMVENELKKVGLSKIENVLINRYSNQYQEWGTYELYTSSYIDISKLYGEVVVAIEEKEARGVDMTWYAYSQRKSKDWPNVDNGEYMMPIIIPANEIRGVIIKEFHQSYDVGKNKVSFFKYEGGSGATYLLEYDNSYYSCLIPKGKYIYNCSYQTYGSIPFVKAPTAKKMARPVAILKLCEDIDSCKINWSDFVGIEFKYDKDLIKKKKQYMDEALHGKKIIKFYAE